jgi:flagellar biosynthesis protein FlhF
MELKTYQGKSMAEALEKVKKDLGRGAVILHTRTIRRGGVMGVGARSIVEITASRDPSLLPKPDRVGIVGRESGTESLPARRNLGEAATPGVLERAMGSLAASGRGGQTAVGSSLRDMGGHGARAARAEGSAMPRPTTPTGNLPASPTGLPPGIKAADALEHISSSTSALRSEMEELRSMVRQLISVQQQMPLPVPAPRAPEAAPVRAEVAPIPEELRDYYTTLIQNAVADELARDVIGRAKERLSEWRNRLQKVGTGKAEPLDFAQLIPNALMEVIERMLPPADAVQIVPGKGPKYVALVGPTGVGKTTTIAKLAAQFKLREHKRVGLITTDTYRIAAIAQLKAYAEILSVPLEIAYTPEELGETMRKMQSFDVVLIDTSGRSQNDVEHLGDLHAFLTQARQTAAEKPTEAAGQPMETHLVLSCTSHSSQLRQVIDKFTPVGIDRVVFTKLDEAVGVGVILNIAHRLDVQLSYLTTGQDVPDDIEVSSSRRIAEMVLNLRKPEAQASQAAPSAKGEIAKSSQASTINAMA